MQSTFAYMYRGGVERPRNFFSHQFSFHRRENACRIRLVSRLFYAHSGFSSRAFALLPIFVAQNSRNFNDFFCFARSAFWSQGFALLTSFVCSHCSHFCPRCGQKAQNSRMFGAKNFSPTFCGKEFCPQNPSKRKNNGKNVRKILFRRFGGRNLARQILCRSFAGTNLLQRIRPRKKIMAKMCASAFPAVLGEGICRTFGFDRLNQQGFVISIKK